MRRVIALASLFALAACGGDSTSAPTQASVAGTWNLTTVNGAPLPLVIQAANPKIELLSDQFVVNAGGTFTQTTNIRATQGTTVTTQTLPDAGTYVLSGTAVTLTFQSDGSTETGTLSGNSLTVTGGGFSGVYTKQ